MKSGVLFFKKLIVLIRWSAHGLVSLEIIFQEKSHLDYLVTGLKKTVENV